MPGKPFTMDNYYSLQTDSVCTNNALPSLGINPTAIAAVVPGYLAGTQMRAAITRNFAGTRTAASACRSYLVGGAVRDRLLGLPVSDRDWVVVGATPEEMLSLGYTPVGKDFPVFLHPQTRRNMRWHAPSARPAPGYTGFEVYADPTSRSSRTCCAAT